MMDSHGIPARARLAAAAAAACLVACLGLPALLGSDAATSAQPPRAKPQAALRSLPAHGHGSELAVPGMSERELRAFETATLGPEHAREHALLRRAQRLEQEGAIEPEPNGKVASVATAGEPSDVGEWETGKVNFAVVAIHAAMLPTGKVMIFSYPKSPQENSAQAWLWDPATGQKTRKDPPLWQDPEDGQWKAANIWCSGHTFTADGELVVFGGNLEFPSGGKDYKGLNKVYTFNPFTETWREQPDMRHGRWYPTGVRLPDGRIPILSGWDESGDDVLNTDVEIFNPPGTIGGLGSIGLIGGTGGVGQPPTGEYYPHMFTMPSGRTLIAGPDAPNTWFMNTPGTSSFSWSDAPNLSQRRLWGTAVPLPAGAQGSKKIMALGGTDYSALPATATTEVFDEANPSQGWRSAPSNAIGRAHANTVLLPDGSMVEVGGGIGSNSSLSPQSPLHAALPEQRQIELWNPDTGEWRLGPAQTESRAYHSTALLLPDGRVFSSGDDWNGGITSDTAEIYKPPYLFKGPRPTIASAPTTIRLGSDFGVETPDTNVTGAALIAPGSVTHAVDMNQRYIELDVTRRTGCVDLEAPPSANVAPPGYYMLFLVNDQGVPSVAKWVKLATGGGASTCGGPPADMSPPSVSITGPAVGAIITGSVPVTANASDNVGVAGVQFKLDGQSLGAEDTSAPYSTTWNPTLADNGVHVLSAVARDAAGNTKTATTVAVTVLVPDLAAPSVSLTAPANGATITGALQVTAGASDNVGVAGVQFKLDGLNLGAEDTSAPYAVPWSPTFASNGLHQLKAVARDVAGNTKTSTTVNVTVAIPDGSPPTVSLLSPAGGATVSGTVDVSAMAADAEGLAGVQFKLDGQSLAAEDGLSPFSVSWDTTSVANGTHVLTAVARDQANNKTTSAQVSVTVDNRTATEPPDPPPPDPPVPPGLAPLPSADTLAPTISALRLSAASFHKSTTIGFRLSEAADVVLSFERKLAGHRSRGKCVAPARKGQPRCVAYSALRTTLSFAGKPGANTIILRGRLSARRRLSPGSYRLSLVAVDLSGNRSKPARAGFKLK